MYDKKAWILQLVGVAILYIIAILISSIILYGDKQTITFLIIGLCFMTSTLIISLTDKENKMIKHRSNK